MIEFDRTPLETDVLIAGGGIAGLMAAIRAADQGVVVTVAEKANTLRSGSGATGNDHFLCYIPEVHGEDLRPLIQVAQDSILGKFNDLSMVSTLFQNSFERVRDWERWGIPMRPTGQWEFTGHAFPGKPRLWLKFAGANQKEVLTREARQRGVRVENHLIITDVITRDGAVCGAIGLRLKGKTPVAAVFRAKSVILATGSANRLYPPPSPGRIFNTAYCPGCTGTGRALGYRAGARLVNMEFPNRHAGPKYLARCGKASWIGVFTDSSGGPVGPFVQKPTRELGDITADIWNSVFTDFQKSGRGPVYMDCTRTSDEDIQYMMWGLIHEGQTALLDYMKAEGIDVTRHRVEFMQYEPFLTGRGLDIDLRAETTLPGLFAAGDEVGNLRGALCGAATFGWIAGQSAAERARQIAAYAPAEQTPIVGERIGFYSEILERDSGPTWMEANLALQQMMRDYAGEIRSETLLRAGLDYLRELKEKTASTLSANDSHSLMRSLETMDLMDCGEMVLRTALERRETRGLHIRSDHPYTNPLWQDKFITISRESGDVRTAWRDRR